MDTATVAVEFDDTVERLNAVPRCTIRLDNAPCRHRAESCISKRCCCHDGGVDFICDTCQLRLEFLFALGVRFECVSCGVQSATFTEMFPVVVLLPPR